jgi:hypothetical protein
MVRCLGTWRVALVGGGHYTLQRGRTVEITATGTAADEWAPTDELGVGCQDANNHVEVVVVVVYGGQVRLSLGS